MALLAMTEISARKQTPVNPEPARDQIQSSAILLINVTQQGFVILNLAFVQIQINLMELCV